MSGIIFHGRYLYHLPPAGPGKGAPGVVIHYEYTNLDQLAVHIYLISCLSGARNFRTGADAAAES